MSFLVLLLVLVLYSLDLTVSSCRYWLLVVIVMSWLLCGYVVVVSLVPDDGGCFVGDI